MSVLIPLRDDLEHFSEQVELDGRTFTLEFRWNAREEAWYLSVADADENSLATGVKLVVGWPLLTRYASADMPPGQLMADDTSGRDQEAGLTDLGRRVLLFYFNAEEVGAL